MMGTRTGNPTWANGPATTSPLTAAALNNIESAIDASSADGHTHTATGISDSTSTGRALVTAADAAAARTAAGAAAASHTHGVTDLTATGTKDATTFLRGDNTWAVPAGGGGGSGVDDYVPHVAGMWRTPLNVAGSPGIEPVGASGVACFSPFLVTKASASFTDLGINVTTAGGAGAIARMGIFNLTDRYNIAGGGSLHTDFGTVAVTSTGWKQATAGSPAVLTPGVYLLCVWHSVDSAFRVDAINNPSGGRWSAPSASFGVADPGGGRILAGWYKSSVNYSAGLPSTVASLNGASAGIQAVTCVAAKMG